MTIEITKRHQNPADPREAGFLPSISFLKKFEGSTPRKVRHARLEEKKGKFDAYGNKKEAAHFVEGRLGEDMLFKPDSYMSKYWIQEKAVNEKTDIYQFLSTWQKAIIAAKSGDPLKEANDFLEYTASIEKLRAKIESGAYDDKIEYIKARESSATFITPSMHDNIKACSDYVKVSSPIMKIIADSQTSVNVRWKNAMTGVELVGEIDILRKKGVTDIKYLEDISPDTVARHKWSKFGKLGYIEQAAAYMEAAGFLTYVDGNIEITRGKEATIFAIEKKAPYGWKEYPISYDDLHVAYHRFSDWCAIYKHVKENDLWEIGYQYDELYQMTGYLDGEGFPKYMEERDIPELHETSIF